MRGKFPSLTIKDWWTDFGSQYPKNTTTAWCDTDKENNPTRNFGYPYNVTYTFNEIGMRSIPFEQVPGMINILVSGCSHTVGIGVPVEMIWSRCLSEMIPNSVVHNVAIGGASPDYVARSIYIALRSIKPDLIFILWPDRSRIEIYRNDHIKNIQASHPNYPKIFVDDTHHFNTMKKNQLLVDLVSQGIPVYHGTIHLVDGTTTGLARDGEHGCHQWHTSLAQSFYFKYQHNDLENKFQCYDHIVNYSKNVQSSI